MLIHRLSKILMPFFDKGSIDGESAVTLEKCPLEELNLKMRISAIFNFSLDTRGYFSTFLICGPLCIQIFYISCINKIMEQNVQKVLFFGPCILSYLISFLTGRRTDTGLLYTMHVWATRWHPLSGYSSIKLK